MSGRKLCLCVCALFLFITFHRLLQKNLYQPVWMRPVNPALSRSTQTCVLGEGQGCAKNSDQESTKEAFVPDGDMAEEQSEEFHLHDVLVTFKACLSQDNDLDLDEYLRGWKTLIKFMNSLGTIFSFVSTDAVSKIGILERLRKQSAPGDPGSMQAMIRAELAAGRVDFKMAPSTDLEASGTRTFLRLHRALLWLRLFLERLQKSTPDGRTSLMCSEAYEESLAQHHPWFIRKLASVAFYTLPSRKVFFEAMHAGTDDEVVSLLQEALPALSVVYDIAEKFYEQNNLLDLP
uniref:ceramide-1-phosphate transfer protein n=1 Tax=Myxine glutinosa TaxID=7769 RepID=UPI00358F3659